MPVWIRSELGVYTGKYGVSTDRQGSNADHAGNAYGANTDFKEEHGGYWVLLRSLHGGDIDRKMMSKLLPLFPEVHNTIVEPSESQLSLFKELVKEDKGDLPNVTFTWREDTVDRYVEELESNLGGSGGICERFHLIHLVHSLYYTDDLTRTLRVLHQALEEGGVLFISILPNDSVFNKLDDIQIKHGASRPRLWTDQDVTASLDSLRLPHRLDRGTWCTPSSLCFQENSQDGQHLLDFWTHTKNFRRTASKDLQEEIFACLRSPASSKTETDGEILFFRDWVHITVVKE
eukprot:XP_003729823.2 PREDICTED: histamine N-methyltransferase A-like [Strongylocentrotus purpuratus]